MNELIINKELKKVNKQAKLIDERLPKEVLFFVSKRNNKVMAKLKYRHKTIENFYLIKDIYELTKWELIYGILSQEKKMPILSFMEPIDDL